MNRILIIAAFAACFALLGCQDRSEPPAIEPTVEAPVEPAPDPAPSAEEIPLEADFEEAVRSEITTENFEQQLAALEEQVEKELKEEAP